MKNVSKGLLTKLAAFKEEPIVIPKSKKGFGYKYAPLDTILPIVEPLLRKHGLWYFHTTDFDKISWKTYLKTVIYELEPEDAAIPGTVTTGWITSKILIDEEVVLAKMNKFMVLGSALTYFRRYHLVVMLGLITDEDTDAGGGGGGRSVEGTAKEQDFVVTFKGLIKNGQTQKQIVAFYKTYEKNFSETQKEEIQKLIKEKFPKEEK